MPKFDNTKNWQKHSTNKKAISNIFHDHAFVMNCWKVDIINL